MEISKLQEKWANLEKPRDQQEIEAVDILARKTLGNVKKQVRTFEAEGKGGEHLSQDIAALAESVERVAQICENADFAPVSREQAALAERLLTMRAQLQTLADHSHHVYHDIVLLEKELQADYDHNIIHLGYPEAFQHEAEKCFALFLQANDPKIKQLFATFACKYYEKAVFGFLKKGDPEAITRAADIRSLLASHPDLFRSSKLNRAFLEDINQPAIMHHALLGEMNLGVGITDIGGASVKRQAVHISRIPLDGSNKTVIDFKMTYPFAEEVRENMNLLSKNPVGYRDLMEASIGHKIRVRKEPYMYYHKNTQENTFTSSPPGALAMGKAIVVEVVGIGRVEIGNSNDLPSIYNKVRIVLEEGATDADLQKLLTICGLSNIYTDATTYDKQRLDFNFVLHQLYPGAIALLDKKGDFYVRPMRDILNELDRQIPGSKKEVLDAMGRVERYMILPGVEGLKIKGIGEEITREGARGFISGVGSANSIRQSSQIVTSIVQSGAFASQTRFDQGLLLGGACSRADHERNGADSVYTRVVTQKAIDNREKIVKVPLCGKYQLLYHVDIANQQNYCHSKGYYGCRNADDPRFGQHYLKRPNMKEHTRNNQKEWVDENEVMFKNRLDSGYIRQILYQDPRRMLMNHLIQRNPEFFADRATEAEKLAYLSLLGKSAEGLAQIEQALGPQAHFFQKIPYSLKDHWTVDPKAQLIEDLNAIGVHSIGGKPLDEVIQEADHFSDEVFSDCHEGGR